MHESFVYAALVIGLTAGFGYASVIVAALAFKWPLGAWWIALVQAHGHAQLFGWAGLIVMGVGLYFLPRLRGVALARPELAPVALTSLVSGIVLRSICQPLLATGPAILSSGLRYESLAASGWALSGVLELVGVGLILTMLASSFRRARSLSESSPILPVRPYLAVAGISLSISVVLNAFAGMLASLRGDAVVPASLDDLGIELMIYGFLLPMAMALSVRSLPLFLRLAFPPTDKLGPILWIYVAGLVLRAAPTLAQMFGGEIDLSFLAGIGAILVGCALMAFVFELDVLLRRRQPWTTSRSAPPPGYVETRKPTRKDYPDYGEFGRFELLIISAYAWLAFASLVAVGDGAGQVLGNPALVNPDVERHAITVGFVTLLIFGMGARMLPGFSGKARVASPRLVFVTWLLGNLAALFRVAPLIAPGVPGAEIALGVSGAIGWAAVACLAFNLALTFRKPT